MATDFASQALRDVILDHSKTNDVQSLQAFELRESDVGTMRAFMNMRAGLLTPEQIAAIQNVRNSVQQVDLYLYQKLAEGNGSVRVPAGEGGPEIATVTPSFFDLIQEGLDMSLVNQALRQYGSEGADAGAIVRAAFTDHLRKSLPQVFRNIYTRTNAQYVAFLEANIWALNTTPDAGTIYTTYVGDAKQVPNSDKLDILANMQIEAQQNNFNVTGRPTLIISPRAIQIFQSYQARGDNNEINIAQFAQWADVVVDNNITDNAGVAGTLYLIFPGGIGGYNRVFPWNGDPDFGPQGVQIAGDGWDLINIGGNDAAFLTNLPEIRMEVKTLSGLADTTTQNPTEDAAIIDIVRNFSFVTTHGALRSYETDADVSPIIKYELLEA